MKIRALTLFPKMFDCLNESIVGRAVKNGLIDISARSISANTQPTKNISNATIRLTAAARAW